MDNHIRSHTTLLLRRHNTHGISSDSPYVCLYNGVCGKAWWHIVEGDGYAMAPHVVYGALVSIIHIFYQPLDHISYICCCRPSSHLYVAYKSVDDKPDDRVVFLHYPQLLSMNYKTQADLLGRELLTSNCCIRLYIKPDIQCSIVSPGNYFSLHDNCSIKYLC